VSFCIVYGFTNEKILTMISSLTDGKAAHNVEGNFKLGNNEFYLGTIDDVPSTLICIAVKGKKTESSLS